MPEQMTEEQRKALEEKIKNMSPEELKEFQKQQCIFCQIIAGKVPSKKIFEDEQSIAVLDINPATKGHILLLPKEHYAIMPQMPDKELGHLFLVSKYLSQVLLKTMHIDGTSIFVANGLAAGQRAQHFMVHLLPRKQGDKIIDVEEKLLGVEMAKKVKLVVEKRFNELMGIKKEVVSLPEQNLTEQKKEEPTFSEEKESEDNVPPKEPVQKSTQKPKGGKKMQTNLKKGDDEDDDDDDSEEEKLNLDDIARLFK